MRGSRWNIIAAFGVTGLGVLAAVLLLPGWILFPISIALANAIAALGIWVLMRTSNVTFGQSLPYCIGAYGAGLVPLAFGQNELVFNVLLGALAGGLISAVLGVFMTRFTGIFFAMLSLAFSMVAYGLLAKNDALGGTDGFSITPPTVLFHRFDGDAVLPALFAATATISAVTVFLTQRLVRSRAGLAAAVIGKNDLRVTYLGGNVRSINWLMFTYCGMLGGISGALIGMLTGHVSPEYAYWTKSGELVLIAILGSSSNLSLIFVASLLIEGIRTVAASSYPYTWQAVLGIMLLAIILFLPGGLDTFLHRMRRIRKVAEK